jgi:hypothetical protein
MPSQRGVLTKEREIDRPGEASFHQRRPVLRPIETLVRIRQLRTPFVILPVIP